MGAEANGAEPAVEDLVAAGVPLAQYAVVHAALAEEFPLEAVLRHEGLDPDRWAAIDAAWAARMRESAAGDQRLLEVYDAEVASARDRLTRPLPPIDEDLRAWLDFLRAWSTAPDPFEMLEEHGLRSTDLTRLQALWAKRLVAQGSVREQALAILDEPPGPCPAVTASPQALPPPLASRAAAAPQPRKEAPSARRPRLAVPLPGTAGSESDAVDAEPVTGRSPLPPRSPSPGLVSADWAAKSRVYEVGDLPADSEPTETRPPNKLAAARPLPFRPPAPAIVVGAEPDPPASLPPQTAPVPPVLPQAPVLPFAPAPAAHEVFITAPVPAQSRQGGPDIAAALSMTVDRSLSLNPSGAAPKSDAPSWAGATLELPLGSSNIAQALPFAESSPAGKAAAAPKAEGSIGSHPALTIEQYASVWSELAVYPERSSAILLRYGLTEAEAHKRLKDAWAQRFSEDPTLLRTWLDLCDKYRDWLSAQKR